jgi:ribosomal protein L14E/L6E/L27E
MDDEKINHINLELIVTDSVMAAVKNYDINIPEICITAITGEIERLNSIEEAVAQTTASKDHEIQKLKEACRLMRERLDKAEAEITEKKRWRLKK